MFIILVAMNLLGPKVHLHPNAIQEMTSSETLTSFTFGQLLVGQYNTWGPDLWERLNFFCHGRADSLS